MKLIRPVTVDDTVLISSSVAEDDYPAWTAGTYTTGTHRIYEHRIYEVVADPSTTDRPDEGVDATDEEGNLKPTWLDIGPTNAWAMFDKVVGTLTTDTGQIVVQLQPGAIDSLGVLNTDAETVNVTLRTGLTEIYNQTRSTNESGSPIDDWYKYFFAATGKRDTLTFFNLPSYANCIVTITFTGIDPGGPVSVGTLIVGNALDLGATENGADVGILDFSKVDRNEGLE